MRGHGSRLAEATEVSWPHRYRHAHTDTDTDTHTHTHTHETNMKQTCTAKKRRKGKGKGKGPVNTLMQLVPATGMQPKPSAHRPPFHTSPSLHGTHCSGARPRREDTPGRRNQSRCPGPPCDHTARVPPVIIQPGPPCDHTARVPPVIIQPGSSL